MSALDPDNLEVYGPRPGLAETPGGLRRFLPGIVAAACLWAAIAWLVLAVVQAVR